MSKHYVRQHKANLLVCYPKESFLRFSCTSTFKVCVGADGVVTGRGPDAAASAGMLQGCYECLFFKAQQIMSGECITADPKSQ